MQQPLAQAPHSLPTHPVQAKAPVKAPPARGHSPHLSPSPHPCHRRAACHAACPYLPPAPAPYQTRTRTHEAAASRWQEPARHAGQAPAPSPCQTSAHPSSAHPPAPAIRAAGTPPGCPRPASRPHPGRLPTGRRNASWGWVGVASSPCAQCSGLPALLYRKANPLESRGQVDPRRGCWPGGSRIAHGRAPGPGLGPGRGWGTARGLRRRAGGRLRSARAGRVRGHARRLRKAPPLEQNTAGWRLRRGPRARRCRTACRAHRWDGSHGPCRCRAPCHAPGRSPSNCGQPDLPRAPGHARDPWMHAAGWYRSACCCHCAAHPLYRTTPLTGRLRPRDHHDHSRCCVPCPSPCPAPWSGRCPQGGHYHGGCHQPACRSGRCTADGCPSCPPGRSPCCCHGRLPTSHHARCCPGPVHHGADARRDDLGPDSPQVPCLGCSRPGGHGPCAQPCPHGGPCDGLYPGPAAPYHALAGRRRGPAWLYCAGCPSAIGHRRDRSSSQGNRHGEGCAQVSVHLQKHVLAMGSQAAAQGRGLLRRLRQRLPQYQPPPLRVPLVSRHQRRVHHQEARHHARRRSQAAPRHRRHRPAPPLTSCQRNENVLATMEQQGEVHRASSLAVTGKRGNEG